MATNPFSNQPGYPKDFQIVDANGLLQPAWQYFFYNIWQRLQNVFIPYLFVGMPTSGQTISYLTTVAIQIPPNIPGLFTLVRVAPSADAVFTLDQINMDGVIPLGTITLHPDGSATVVTIGASLAVGDILQINAPVVVDPTMSDIEIVIPTLWA